MLRGLTRWTSLLAILLGPAVALARHPGASDTTTEPAVAATAAVSTARTVLPQTTSGQPSEDASVPDLDDAIERIKDEGLNRSQVMATLSYLTDVIGPRLTNSPAMTRANEWTRDKLTDWGLENARLDEWGPFGRGWSLQRFSAQVVAPQCIPLIAYPKAWSPGFDEPLVAEVVHLNAETEADLDKFQGQLQGKIVLTSPAREVAAQFEPPGRRLSDEALLALANAPHPSEQPRRSRRSGPTDAQRAAQRFAARKARFLAEEGAALLIDPSPKGDGGTIFVAAASVTPSPPGASSDDRRPRPWDAEAPDVLPQLVLAVEHYNRIARMLQQGETLTMEVDLAVAFHDDDLMGYNTIAEIPGADLKDQVVMLGGHMDSWHSGTGATDNAAGVAVAMEAVRILQALELQPRRTIRIALWSGEEQGLLGSRAYVRQHFGANDDTEDDDMAADDDAQDAGSQDENSTSRAHENFSAYFNLDNGTGRIRGVYLQGNEEVRPIFRRWLAPFRDMGASTLSIANTGGTDHLAFDAVGLPGFQFIQDPIEYSPRTHHSNQDVFDRIQADDMKQAAVIMAAFAYQTAMRDEPLPRKPRPER